MHVCELRVAGGIIKDHLPSGACGARSLAPGPRGTNDAHKGGAAFIAAPGRGTSNIALTVSILLAMLQRGYQRAAFLRVSGVLRA